MKKISEGLGVFVMWIGVGIMLIGGSIMGRERFNREVELLYGDRT